MGDTNKMTDILEPGSGKSSLYGGTPVVIIDEHEHWLYGWTRYEEIKAKSPDHHLCVIKGINLGMYVAYIEARFPQVRPLTKNLIGTSTIRYQDLLAIDQAITLTQRHASELDEINQRYEAGELTDNAGNQILPTKWKAH